MVRAFLLLGSNQGDRKSYLEKSRQEISTAGTVLQVSSIYQTAAWGKEDQPSFLNQVVEIETDLSPKELLIKMLAIESSLGRVRDEKWGSRIIDIDILFYGSQIVKTPQLTIPHPRIAERRFVLVPMAEVDGGFVHPILRKNIKTLLDVCKDKLDVTKITGDQ
jgi:2-amino-4-hydroxy-6-hydroxymethyldihydropteridine diphosphokinase